MRTLYLLSIIYIGFALTSCATEHPVPRSDSSTTASVHQPVASPKSPNPQKVAFYTKSHPNIPYTVIGEETISKFNQGGNKRQEANIRDGMRELAAAMGGDAVIDIKHDSQSVSGTVVAYVKRADTIAQG